MTTPRATRDESRCHVFLTSTLSLEFKLCPASALSAEFVSPLAAMDVGGAKGCLIQVEGGMGMTIGQVDAVADLFTSALDADAQVILGARVSEDLVDTIRVVTLLAGIRPS